MNAEFVAAQVSSANTFISTQNAKQEAFDAAQLARANEYTTDKSDRDTGFAADQAERVVEFCEFLESSGYEAPVDYVAGLGITRPTQTVRFGGELYRAKGASLPFTTTTWPADSAKFFAIGDAALRQELASTDSIKGATLVAHSTVHVASIMDLQTAKRDPAWAVQTSAYRPGVFALGAPRSTNGGGRFIWMESVPKTQHNGGTVISPSVPWSGEQNTLAAFLKATGETSPGGNGCFVLVLQGELYAEQFGAIGDNASDNSASFQAATNYLQSVSTGGKLRIGLGQFQLSTAIKNDRSTNAAVGRVSYVGADENGTQLLYTGSGNCFEILNSHAVGVENSTSCQIVSDMSIFKVGSAGATVGIVVNLGAWPKFERLNIQGFDYGMYLQDVDHPYFSTVNLRFNNKGIYAQRAIPARALSTAPNNYTFVSCSISNNGTYGMYIVGGSAINWYGGSCEYNGHVIGSAGFGVQLEDCGYEGGVGANFNNVYFEANNGIADVILKTQNVDSGAVLGALHKISSDFHRNLTGSNINNILCVFGPPGSVGTQVLNVHGSAFKSFGGYVPNAATKNISFSDTVASAGNFFDAGAFYADPVERPVFSQTHNKYYATVSKSANQAVPTAVWTKLLLDAVPNFFLLAPSLSTHDISIPETALFNVSATISFSGNVAGLRGVRFKIGSLVVASASTSAVADNVVSLDMTRCMSIGNTLSVEVLQTSGGSLDVQGVNIGNTLININKVVGQ